MPAIEKHIQTSLARTGKEYRQVHEWIDDPEKKAERHDLNRILEFARMFEDQYGEEAAREYVRHLSDDVNARFNHLVDDIREMVDTTLAYFGAARPGSTKGE